MTRTMSDGEILGTVGQMLRTLAEPDPDPDLFRILEDLPLGDPLNMTKLLASTAIATATATLRASGIRTDEDRAGVAHVDIGFDTPADVPRWARDAVQLVAAACNFQVAKKGHDTPQADGVTLEAAAIAMQGHEYALRALADMLAQIRYIHYGDVRGVMVR